MDWKLLSRAVSAVLEVLGGNCPISVQEAILADILPSRPNGKPWRKFARLDCVTNLRVHLLCRLLKVVDVRVCQHFFFTFFFVHSFSSSNLRLLSVSICFADTWRAFIQESEARAFYGGPKSYSYPLHRDLPDGHLASKRAEASNTQNTQATIMII